MGADERWVKDEVSTVGLVFKAMCWCRAVCVGGVGQRCADVGVGRAMDAQWASALVSGSVGSVQEGGDVCLVGGGVEVASSVEVDAVVVGLGDVFKQIDAAIHQRDHGVVRSRPPIAVAFGRFVAGEREWCFLFDKCYVA